ncbi:tRNA modification GTPase TrmE [Boletus reticuloceps]|uniref:tRNA modification GTPase TrmE n=1 Tax=Boletus reticuloceps TaxID=495285 RepID=A0A8I2YN50_9AGAM|nr:tRNA modification GTPase TrmE [Boletus reticuloceps]
MVRPCSSHCSSIGRLRGRSPQSLFASPKLFLPSVIHSFPHRNSTKSFHSHSLPNQSASGGAYYQHSGARHLTPSDAQRRTIYALSTPPGKGGIAVVRVSGPDACKVWKAVTRPVRGSTIDKLPTPRLAELRHIIDPLTGEKLDDGPKSFTTEDVVELQVHSGRAVLSSILRALSRLPYCRPAQPGEFTRRAFEGGRLDLTQQRACGISSMPKQRRKDASRYLMYHLQQGAQRARFNALRAQILDCLMYVEGFIDFGEDVDELGQDRMFEQACARAQGIIDCIRSHLSDNRRGEILRSGIRLVIFGPPNAGKSSLFNFLAERDAAIISPIPGTTRDILSLTLDIGGLPVVLNDTAGIRSTTDDAIERIGVERAGNVIQTADVSICVLSLDEIIPRTAEREVKIAIPDDVIRHLKPDTVFLLNKSDLARPPTHELRKVLNDALPQQASGTSRPCWSISLRSGEGTQEFLDGLGSVLKERYAYTETMSLDGSPLVTQARHRDYLESAVRHLEEFKSYPLSQIDIAAESLRYAARAIGAVSGSEVSTEEVLGAIFSSFCVGK